MPPHALGVVAAAALVIVLAPGGAAASAAVSPGADRALGRTPAAITQPTPPITASAFPVEPAGRAPAANDGLIPNPQTPTGSPITPPSTCAVRFASAGGATSAVVNAWIRKHENAIKSATVVCLSGTFHQPIRIWSKVSTALLEVAPAPGSTATLALGRVRAADTDPNQFWSDSGGISIVDSRSVEIYGLTVQDYFWNGLGHSPAGIYVSSRTDITRTNQRVLPHRSACFVGGSTCGDIYIIKDTVRRIANTGDRNFASKRLCGNGNVDAYGIAVIAAGPASSPPLQHLVIEDNTVTGIRAGQSETVTINGNVSDFLVARNRVHDTDNIGMDAIGWELGTGQARHGLFDANTVYNVDTWSNAAYGLWQRGRCRPQPENAAGIYDDGARYIWIKNNVVQNTDQGINLDVETAHKSTSHLLVSGNTVVNNSGTALSDPSYGPNPPGTKGRSTVAGHDPFALYIDAFGTGASISDVYVHDNTLRNESQYFLTPSAGMPVLDLGGIWSHVQIWHNTIRGRGGFDRYNSLFEVDQQPSGGGNVVDCNRYGDLSHSRNAVKGNFALPHKTFRTLAAWRSGNGHGWDADSALGLFAPLCPARSIL